MLNKFKHFLKHSLVYSISNVASKASGIILLPIYTSYFSVNEFGRLGLIIALITIFVQIVILGQSQSIVRFLSEKENVTRKGTILFTISILIFFVVLFFVLFSELFAPFFSNLLGGYNLYFDPLRISIYIIAATVLNNVFQNKLRADENSVFFTVTNLIKLFFMMIFTIYFIVKLDLGINGVLYGQLISEVVALLILLPSMLKQMELKFDYSIVKASLIFGVPLIFSALAMTFLNISDRFLIKFLADENSLGLYELGYRVAGILNMFMIMPLSLTLLPVAYKIYKNDGDKFYYSKIMTYVTFLLTWGALFLSVFSKEIVYIFSSNKLFWPSSEIIPLILASYVFFGMSMISSLGFYLVGKTGYVALINILAAVINIGLNFLLIPKYGIWGAALNTLLAFIFLYLLSLFVSNRFYKIEFEHKKLVVLLILGSCLYLVSLYLQRLPILTLLLLKLLLISLYPIILFVGSFYEPSELKMIKGFIKKWRNPSGWLENLKKESSEIFTRN
jgi:O-antigen/teichoic acid export membrane protein